MQKQPRFLTLRFGLIIICFWAGYCAVNAFASNYLQECGFEAKTIGVVVALAGIISTVLQPFISAYADRKGSIKLKYIVFILGALIAIFALVISLIPQTAPKVLIAILYAVTIFLSLCLIPISQGMGVAAINHGYKLNYGISRSFGSVGYAPSSVLVGFMCARYSTRFAPLFACIAFVLFSIATILFPVSFGGEKEIAEHKEKGGSLEFFRQYKFFLVAMVGCFGLYVGHSIINTYTIQIIKAKGGGTPEMGVATAIAAAVELPSIAASSFIIRKFKTSTLLKVCGVSFTVKSLLSLLCTNVAGFYCAQACQVMTWGLIACSIVSYANDCVDQKDLIKGQGCTNMSLTIANVVGAVVGGVLIDVSVSTALTFGTICSAIGMIVLFAFSSKGLKKASV